MSAARPLEVWGGVECSFIRIGDDTRDQIAETGHYDRLGDLDLIAALGIRTLRYPVLWETVCKTPYRTDWRWHDIRLKRLKELRIAAIAGLVHHGSGPSYCDILDPDFPEALARYAAEVANRYPWLELFTPINEPMTTARLCGLYGHWYPHGRDEGACFRIVVMECRAIASAMRSVRKITPTAKLVQTEDIGRVFATPELQYQADYESERRWLALDLLTGRVDRRHPLHKRLLECCVDERHLAELADDPCSPDLIGIDQYLTSDRFLDERVERHPHEIRGGNGRHAYVDVAAVRAGIAQEETGFLPRILEGWDRYKLPLALTEVHNGCTRDEQLRWLIDAWDDAKAARDAGVDFRAISVWSLFGAMDWNSLLMRRGGFYEPGAFDARFVPPRPTVIAQAIRNWSQSTSFTHPVLCRRGWWKTDEQPKNSPTRPILLTASGRLARLVADCCIARRLDVVEVEASSDSTEQIAWAVVDTESGFGGSRASSGNTAPLRLTCRYLSDDGEGSGTLVVEATHSFDPVYAVHVFLDFMIDGVTGNISVTRAAPDGQCAFAIRSRPAYTADALKRAV